MLVAVLREPSSHSGLHSVSRSVLTHSSDPRPLVARFAFAAIGAGSGRSDNPAVKAYDR